MYSCVIPGERRKHYKDILEIYLTSLKKSLAEYGIDLPPTITLEEVEKEMKRLRLFAFLILSLIFCWTTFDVEHTFNPNAYFGSDESNTPLNPAVFKRPWLKNHVAEDILQFTADGTF